LVREALRLHAAPIRFRKCQAEEADSSPQPDTGRRAPRLRSTHCQRLGPSAAVALVVLLALAVIAPVGWAQVTEADVARHNAAIVWASYGDTLHAARRLQASIHRFVGNSSEAGLHQARRAWLDARAWYG
jgi:uncharacterized iron-regulated protein